MSPNDVAAWRTRLAGVTTSAAADALRAIDPMRLTMRGITLQSGDGRPIAGPARTVRFLPSRGDVASGPHGNVRMEAVDDAGPGDVLVFDAMGYGGPLVGDMVGLRAHHNGVLGAVVDGTVRDLLAVAELGLSVYACGTAPGLVASPVIPWERDVPVACGGVLVLPGDWILADRDGVMVVPASLLETLETRVMELTLEERFSAELLRSGQPLSVAYPLPDALRPLFVRYRETGALPSFNEIQAAFDAHARS